MRSNRTPTRKALWILLRDSESGCGAIGERGSERGTIVTKLVLFIRTQSAILPLFVRFLHAAADILDTSASADSAEMTCAHSRATRRERDVLCTSSEASGSKHGSLEVEGGAVSCAPAFAFFPCVALSYEQEAVAIRKGSSNSA